MTETKVRSRYYWPGWLCEVKKCVQQCFACSMDKLKRTGIQAKMVQHHPQRRFQVVGIDVMEVSPTSRQGNKKVIVIGDLFSRYVVAVAVADESAKTVARVLFERWVAIFCVPEALLSNRGRELCCKVTTELCDCMGTGSLLTSASHTQSNGFIERYNRTLAMELRHHNLEETNWDEHLTMTTFQYNATEQAATGITAFHAVFGTDAFEFDCGLMWQWRVDDHLLTQSA
jgi:transposase InsO family protein